MHTIGIDFGTSKTLVAHISDKNNRVKTLRLGRGNDFVPTTAYISNEGELFFADDAEDRLEDLDGSYLRGFKMRLGSQTPLHIILEKGQDTPRYIYAKELVKEFLCYIRKTAQSMVFMDEPVTRAVITRPVNFSPAQCEELKEAAKAAGFTELTFTTEPEAAGLAFCQLYEGEPFRRNALIVDWGGGTLDFALVTREEDRVLTHAKLTDGTTDMGGEIFDFRLWEHVRDALEKKGVSGLNHIHAMPKIRLAKENLSSAKTTTLRLSHAGGACPPITITRDEFNELIIEDIEKAAKKVTDLLKRIPQEYAPEMLLLVGGSSRIPLIKEQLEAATDLPAKPWNLAHEAVALGAALWQHHTRQPQAALPEPHTPPSITAAELPHVSVKQAKQTLRSQFLLKPAAFEASLLSAAEQGNIELINLHLCAKTDPFIEDKNGNTLIHLAAAGNHPECLKLLLAHTSYELNKLNKQKQTPLHTAICANNTACALLLIEQENTDVNKLDTQGQTPLSNAILNANTELAAALLQAKKINVNKINRQGIPPVSLAIQHGNEPILKLLLKARKIDPNKTDKQGITPLAHALRAQTPALIQLLLEHENTDLSDRDTIELAILAQNTKALEHHLLANQCLNTPTTNGETPLSIAAKWGIQSIISKLLSLPGIDVFATNTNGETALHTAIANGHTHCAEQMLRSLDTNTPEIKNRITELTDHAIYHDNAEFLSCIQNILSAQARPELLYKAAMQGSPQCVALLCTLPGYTTGLNWFPLMEAVATNNTASVKNLIQSGCDANATLADGTTALILGVIAGYPRTVKALLSAPGIDVNRRGNEGITALSAAIIHNRQQCFSHLLEAENLDHTAADAHGNTPLMYCAMHNRAKMAEALILANELAHRGLNIEGKSALDLARDFNAADCIPILESVDNVRAVKQLKMLGIDSTDKTQAITQAILNNNVPALQLMIQAGWPIKTWNTIASSPLSFAASTGQAECLQLLLQAGANVNSYAPLKCAVINGQTECVRILISTPDIQINKTDSSGNTPLYHAIVNGHTECANLLLQSPGMNIQEESKAFFQAIKHRQYEIAEQFSARFDALYAQRSDLCRALNTAINLGDLRLSKLILQCKNANIKGCFSAAISPLHIAITNRNAECLELLLQQPGIPLNNEDDSGYTPLICAIKSGYAKGVALLLQQEEIDIDTPDSEQITPLIHAVECNNAEIVSALLAEPYICSVNTQDISGRTALHIAAINEYADIAELLLNHSFINPHTTDNDGKTAADYALLHSKSQTAKVFHAHGFRRSGFWKKAGSALLLILKILLILSIITTITLYIITKINL